ncbi:MAG: helix-turn-helix transcriptional regulator [Clostridia bacterium]|nr:helix-turn-helix transcriptional regulator [Clostridia bacterium]
MLEETFANGCEVYFGEADKQIWHEKRYSYRNTSRQRFGLFLLAEGEVSFQTEEHRVEAVPGTLVFLPKNSRYDVWFNIQKAAVISYLINFDLPTVDVIGGMTTPTILTDGCGEPLVQAFARAVEEYLKNGVTLRYKALFYACLDELETKQKRDSAGGDDLLFAQAKRLMQETDMTVGEIAHALHISQSGLQKGFIKRFEQSPIAYRTAWKLKESARLLTATDWSVQQIAAHLRFYDAAYFSKTFKAHYGCTPKAFRDRHRRSLII